MGASAICGCDKTMVRTGAMALQKADQEDAPEQVTLSELLATTRGLLASGDIPPAVIQRALRKIRHLKKPL